MDRKSSAPQARPPTERFLVGRDEIRTFLQQQGDRANYTSGGLYVTRTQGSEEQLVFVECNALQGVVRFLAVAPLPKIPPDRLERAMQAVTVLQAELALGGVMLFRERVSVRTHAFLNHDGSISARVIESGMRLTVVGLR